METHTHNLTIRMLPPEQRIISELQDRFAESGIALSSTDIVRLALRKLPVDPAKLFEGAPR